MLLHPYSLKKYIKLSLPPVPNRSFGRFQPPMERKRKIFPILGFFLTFTPGEPRRKKTPLRPSVRKTVQTLKNIYAFYRDGFARMSRLGRMLWVIILVKVAILFLVLKVFFFQDYLDQRFDTPEQKTQYVLEALSGQDK